MLTRGHSGGVCRKRVGLVAAGVGFGRDQHQPWTFRLDRLRGAPKNAEDAYHDNPGEQDSKSNGGCYRGSENERCKKCGHECEFFFLLVLLVLRDPSFGHVHRHSIPV